MAAGVPPDGEVYGWEIISDRRAFYQENAT
jgi:hypothetical protein